MKKRKTIFLVDDDEDDRMLMTEAIQEMVSNVEIIEIENGSGLLDMLKDRQGSLPDLVLMDMNMPKLNGLEILFAMKTNPVYNSIPVVILSTTSTSQLIGKAYELGANAFMIKPVAQSEFEMIARAIDICFLNRLSADRFLASIRPEKARSILIIEDNDDHSELMDFAIRQSMPDVRAIRLADRASTLEFLKTKYKNLRPVPEMILLDLYLPTREDGLKLLDEIPEFIVANNLAHVPIIVFSYSDHHEDRSASYAKQANGYVIKHPDISKWSFYFENLCYFWSKTMRLPQV
jgi:CheY-like chemotaxis protein